MKLFHNSDGKIQNKLFPSDTASESEALIIILFVYATASNLPVGEYRARFPLSEIKSVNSIRLFRAFFAIFLFIQNESSLRAPR